MSKPVFYHHNSLSAPVKTMAELQTVGSIITILDFVLVNGGNELNILSFTRVGTVGTIKTETGHSFSVKDVIHIQDTLEATVNGKFHVLDIPAPDEITIQVLNVGATSLGAVGTVKNAAAGWTKKVSGFNSAIYESGPLHDGTKRQVQVIDNGQETYTYYFSVIIGKGMTAIDTGEVVSDKQIYDHGHGHGKWQIIADDKTIYMAFNWSYLYCIGAMIPHSLLDTPPFYISCGVNGYHYNGKNFGSYSSVQTTHIKSSNTGLFLEGMNGFGRDAYSATTILGSLDVNMDLNTKQVMHRGINTLDGSLLLSTCDIWEKVGEGYQQFAIRARARGFYQPYGKIPFNYLNNPDGFFSFKSLNLDGKDRDMILLCPAGYTVSQVAIDITGDW